MFVRKVDPKNIRTHVEKNKQKTSMLCYELLQLRSAGYSYA